jgi:hypothetical protein
MGGVLMQDAARYVVLLCPRRHNNKSAHYAHLDEVKVEM